MNVKETLGLEYPNLPYLIDGDVKITETVAIMQYIAKKYCPSLLGTSAAEVGRISMLLDKVGSLKMKATIPCYLSGDAEAIMAECKPLLEKILECMGDNDWIVGSSITWLDFFFAELVDMLNAVSEGAIYQDYPKT